MNMLSCLLLISLFIPLGLHLVLFYRAMNYAYLDTASILSFAGSMIGRFRIKRNFVLIFPEESKDPINEEFCESQVYFGYNTYLNLLNNLNVKSKFLLAKKLTIAIFFLFLISIAFLSSLSSSNIGISDKFYIISSLIFTLVIGCNSKLQTVVGMALSDVLNYLFLVLAILIVSCFNGWVSAVSLGLIVGLAFRNRTQDIVLFLAGVVHFVAFEDNLWLLLQFVLVFALVNIEFIFFELFGMGGGYSLIAAHLRHFSPYYRKARPGWSPVGQRLLLKRAILRSLDPYAPDSLWHSLGVGLILGMVSLVYLLLRLGPRPEIVFPSVVAVSLYFLSLFMRNHFVSGSGELIECYYFGGRQMYVLIPIWGVLSSISLGLALETGDHIALSIYGVGLFLCICHQAYRLADVSLSPVIVEKNFVEYRKEPEPWSRALGDFLRSRSSYTVVLGSHLFFGYAHDFYQWSAQVRCVDVHKNLSDEELVSLIEKYGVTHVVLTPLSCLRNQPSSLGGEKLGSLLSPRLREVPMLSSSLKIYEVNAAAGNCL